jgi:hypothetical protein
MKCAGPSVNEEEREVTQVDIFSVFNNITIGVNLK